MRILVHGCSGRMGRAVMELLGAGFGGHTLAAGVARNILADTPDCYPTLAAVPGKADCVVDFSNHTATDALLTYCEAKGLPVVIATTGHTPEETARIQAAAKHIPVFLSANMSVGVALLVQLAKQTAMLFPEADIEIVEIHHNQKLDVPSGTALMLANGIREVRRDAELVVGRHENGKRSPQEIGIHSLRLGSEVGTHEVVVSTGTQTITLKHEAENRALFAEGALTAAAFLAAKPAGLYVMNDLVG